MPVFSKKNELRARELHKLFVAGDDSALSPLWSVCFEDICTWLRTKGLGIRDAENTFGDGFREYVEHVNAGKNTVFPNFLILILSRKIADHFREYGSRSRSQQAKLDKIQSTYVVSAPGSESIAAEHVIRRAIADSDPPQPAPPKIDDCDRGDKPSTVATNGRFLPHPKREFSEQSAALDRGARHLAIKGLRKDWKDAFTLRYFAIDGAVLDHTVIAKALGFSSKQSERLVALADNRVRRVAKVLRRICSDTELESAASESPTIWLGLVLDELRGKYKGSKIGRLRQHASDEITPLSKPREWIDTASEKSVSGVILQSGELWRHSLGFIAAQAGLPECFYRQLHGINGPRIIEIVRSSLAPLWLLALETGPLPPEPPSSNFNDVQSLEEIELQYKLAERKAERITALEATADNSAKQLESARGNPASQSKRQWDRTFAKLKESRKKSSIAYGATTITPLDEASRRRGARIMPPAVGASLSLPPLLVQNRDHIGSLAGCRKVEYDAAQAARDNEYFGVAVSKPAPPVPPHAVIPRPHVSFAGVGSYSDLELTVTR